MPDLSNTLLYLDRNENSDSNLKEFIKGSLSSCVACLYPNYEQLTNILADVNGVQSDNIILTSGCTEAINIAIRTFVGGLNKTLIRNNTYPYAVDQILNNTNKCLFYVGKEGIVAHKKEFIPNFIYLCNPNNPTGCVYTKNEIEQILRTYSDSIVFLDETYVDFIEYNCSDLISKYSNLIIGRSFSKAWGCAGLRMGYIISNSKFVTYMDKQRLKASINSVGVQVVIELLKNSSFVKESIINIKSHYEIIKNFITHNGGKILSPNTTNFVYFESPQNLFANKNCIIRDYKNGTFSVAIPSNKNEITRFLID